MFAVLYQDHGDTSVMRLGGLPEPHAGPDAIRIRVLTTSVNPIDRLVRAGYLREMLPLPLPIVPGRDAAGIVDEIGEGVTGVAPGDRVFGLGGVSDTTAEYAILTAWAKIPAGWSDEQAAAAGLASATGLGALDALAEKVNLDGATVLVDGAAGAVGAAAAAFAIAQGAHVIGTAREANHDYLRSFGVTPVVYGEGLVDRVRAVAPDGVDLALDAAGSGSLPQLIELTGSADRVVTVADHQRAGDLGVRIVDAVNDSSLLERAAAFGDAGRYRPRVTETASLTDVPGAHERSEAGSGKIAIRVGHGGRLASLPTLPAGDADGDADGDAAEDTRVATVRRLVAAQNARDYETLRELTSDPITINGTATGFEQYRQALSDTYAIVPDFHYELTGVEVTDGVVAISLLDTGTPTTPWLGHPADGSMFAALEHVTYRFDGARISVLDFDLDTDSIAPRERG